MRVVLLRHGESEANVKRLFAGHLDTPLTERGRAQAEQAALYMGWYHFVRVAASPLERAYETALLATELDLRGEGAVDYIEIEKWPEFKEMAFGLCEGMTMDAIKTEFPALAEAFAADYANAVYPEGESLTGFYQRVVKAYETFLESCRGLEGDVLLVTHSGVIRAILAHEISCGFEGYWRYRVENCGFAVIEYDGRFPILSEINNAICKE